MPSSPLHATAAPPALSVVIPARDEEVVLVDCLNALDRQDYAGRYEVIVVDNGSTDSTAAVARRHGARLVQEQRPGSARARRAGFAAARGAIVVSTDADSVAPEDWLRRIASTFAAEPALAGLVGGIVYTTERRLLAAVLRVVMAIALFLDRRFRGHFSEANFAVRRSAYAAVGGFRIGASEGMDLTRRLRAAGYRLRVDHRLRVETSARRFETAFWRTSCRYARNWLYIVVTGRPHPRPLERRFSDVQAAPAAAE